MSSDADLLRRRAAVLAPSYQLFYDEPVHLVRGEGVWLYDVDGKRYLDCYNNVPSVGHAHPRVVAALARQTGLLNTHTRYLNEHVVELAERLGASLAGELSSCFFVCTGTEANDLAVQIARVVSGNHGVVVTERAYHGNSDLVGKLSTDSYPESERPDWLGVVEPPNTYRGPFRAPEPELGARYAALVGDAVAELDARGHGVAAMLIDTSWDSNGVLIAPDDYVERAAMAVRAAGGLVIADEVQAGYCRLGRNFWGHANYGLVPDIVTVGKPMGAGHPVAAVVTTPEVAARFAERRNYFNTFGGNPVSAAVALTVLDVIADEDLLSNSRTTGALIGAALADLASRCDLIGNVQGSGMFWGLDLVADRATREPVAYADAKRLASALRNRGVLTGVTGRYTNVLKLRPPLVFRPEHVELLVETLDDLLSTFELRGGDDVRALGAEW
ncbi:MAG TPA: aminotransferase class III-fold pyridoxal phosphate-dependent enzyme [Ilumatobacter sp.]|nr:aminotransferase class III-fold pyridoxal phosphate-dependent enzyme [Ilumatobacter sp.]